MSVNEKNILMNNKKGGNIDILYPVTKVDNVIGIEDKADTKKLYTATIDTSWTGTDAPYTKTVAVQGIEATDMVNMYPVWSNDLNTRKTQKENYNKISKVDAGANAITLTCDEEKPTIQLQVRIEVTY